MKIHMIRVITPMMLCMLASQEMNAECTQQNPRELVVTNTKDCGRGSLRWAINKANKCGTPAHISFELKKNDPGYDCVTKKWTIKTESSIEMTGPSTTVDGFSQKGSKPNTNAAGEPNNACVKVIVQTPPVVSENSLKAMIAYISKSLARNSKALTQAPEDVVAKSIEESVRGVMDTLVSHHSKDLDAAIAQRLLLPVSGSTTMKGIIIQGHFIQ